jgi:hypothetical protein
MHWNRRDVVKLLAGSVALAAAGRQSEVQAANAGWAHPKPSTFASGDLLWPALPNTYMPYERGMSSQSPLTSETEQWAKAREAFLQQLSSRNMPGESELRERLKQMSYPEFRAMFFQDREMRSPGPQERSLFSAQHLSVGHVGILEIDGQGKIWVIEAMPKGSKSYSIVFERLSNGVIRTPYNTWAKQHEGYNIWHGRVKTETGRARIAEAAKSFLGRDYWIWSLDFSDETAFYCSKLVWVSVYKSLGFALDGDKTMARQLWLSPKRLMKLDTVSMLFSPAPYGE